MNRLNKRALLVAVVTVGAIAVGIPPHLHWHSHVWWAWALWIAFLGGVGLVMYRTIDGASIPRERRTHTD